MSDRNAGTESRWPTTRARSRWVATASALVLVAAVAVAVNGVGGSPRRPTRVEALDVLRPTTTRPAATTTARAVATTAVTTTTSAPRVLATVPTTAPATAPSTTTTSRPTAPTSTRSCVQSHDPACGPMYFSPPPLPDRPLRIAVTQSPANPTTGELVTFHVVFDDPDGPIGCVAKEFDGVSGVSNECGYYPACDRYGAWPPPPPSPGHDERTYTETYQHPGHYTFEIDVTQYNTPCVDSRTGRGANPYVTPGSASLPFTVT